MLVDFRVKNFALIDELEINFKNHLNVLTGETGAGKSIIIGALEILLGARASTEIIRSGKETAYIEAVFEPKLNKEINTILEKSGIEVDPEILLLSRELNLNGRNRSRINGQLVTAAMVKEVSKYLVDIHGQHEHQSILDRNLHIQLLDDFIGKDIIELKNDIAEIYLKMKNIENQLADLEVDDSEKTRQIDLLNYQINEIERTELKDGEMEELLEEYNVLSNIENIFSITAMLSNNINGETHESSSLIDRLGLLLKEIESIKDFNKNLLKFYQNLKDVFYQLQDLGYQLRDYHDSLEYDEERLDKIEKRINIINALQKKYGNTIRDIIVYKEKIAEERDNLEANEKLIEDLKVELKNLLDSYSFKSNNLSILRKKKALELERLIVKELQDLAMEDTRFKVVFNKKKTSIEGIDRIEFLISSNKGEELKPLVKISSGGEMSRIMLALKTIIADLDKVDTLVFDEVDSGVGGKTAQMMAEKLAKIGINKQVLTITHLPQIASMADVHYYITKSSDKEHSYTRIFKLDRNGKKEELARMLGGVKLTDTTLKHAEEMIKMAENKKALLS